MYTIVLPVFIRRVQTRSLRIFSPWPMPNIVEKVISVAPSFDLEAAMQEADVAGEAADGNDEANIPLNLGKPNRTFSMHPSSSGNYVFAI